MATTKGSNKVSNDTLFAIFWKDHVYAILEKLEDKLCGQENFEEKLRVTINSK